MAITQTRMLALIKIADEFKDQLLFTNRTIASIFSDLPANPSPADLLSAIQSFQSIAQSITLNANALEILATEKAHFKLNATRNARHAARARQKRGSDSRPANTAPDMLGRHVPDGYGQFFQKSTAGAIPVPQSQRARFTGATAVYNQVTPISDAELAKIHDEELANQKIKLNKLAEASNMPEPYPDWADSSVPLSDDHKRALGLPVAEDDDSLF